MDPNLPLDLADLAVQFAQTAQAHAAERALLQRLLARLALARAPVVGRLDFAAPVPPTNPRTPDAGLLGLGRGGGEVVPGLPLAYARTRTGMRPLVQLSDAELLGVVRAALAAPAGA